jgi:hypothetical protein
MSGAPRRKTREGLLFAQERKFMRQGACSWAAWNTACRNTLLKGFLQSRERSR